MSVVDFETVNSWLIVRFRTGSLTDPLMIERADDEIRQQLAPLPLRAQVVLDFRQVEFASSQVIGLLLGVRDQLNKKHGTLVLAKVGEKIREALTITNLGKHFRIEPSVSALVGPRPARRRRKGETVWMD